MAVYQKRNNELVEVPCDCGGGGGTSGGNIVISDAIDSTSSFTAASSKAVKTAYDHAGELVQSQLDNQESQLNVGIVTKVNNCIQDKIDSGQIGNGTGDVPASVLNRVNNNEVRSIKNETDITSLKTEVNTLKISVGNAAGFNTRITELEVKRTTDRSDIDNLQQTLTGYDALKAQVEANKSKLEAISSGGEGGGGGTGGSLADIESNIAKLRQDVDQNTVNLSSTSSQAEKNKDDIEALGQLIGDLPTTTDVYNLSNRINKNSSDIELLESAINDLSGGSFSELTSALDTVTQSIDTINTSINDIQDNIRDVTSSASTLKTDFEKTKTEFDNTKADYDTFKTETTTNLASINSSIVDITDKLSTTVTADDLATRLAEIIDNFEDSEESLQQRLSAVEIKAQTLATNLETLTSSLEQIVRSLENVQQNQEALSSDVSKLQDDYSSINNSIGDLTVSLSSYAAESNDRLTKLEAQKWNIYITEDQESELVFLASKLPDGGSITVVSDK